MSPFIATRSKASPEPVTKAALTAGSYFPGDRLFAVENGPSGFDPENPQHQPKIKYLMLMRDERLATLRTRYDDAAGTLSIIHEGREAVRADLATKDGRLAVEAFFRRFMPHELRGAPKVLTAPATYRFTDSPKGFVSIINLASVAGLETLTGAAVNPLRFRGNLYVTGWPAWHEFDLLDRGNLGRRRAAEGDQAHRALRGDQRRSRHRRPRPQYPEDADGQPRSRRLRRLLRDHRRRRDQAGGQLLR